MAKRLLSSATPASIALAEYKRSMKFVQHAKRDKMMQQYTQNVNKRALGSYHGKENPYVDIANTSKTEQKKLIKDLESHGKSISAQRLRQKYFTKLSWGGKRVAEIGCGTGIVTRAIAAQSQVQEVVGVDPSKIFLEQAKHQADNGFLCSQPDASPIDFIEGDASNVPKPDNYFDLVIFHETLSYVPTGLLKEALEESWRILKPGGLVSVFDNDYPSIDYFNSPFDPIREAFDFYVEESVLDPYFMRKVKRLFEHAGYQSYSDLKIFMDVEQTIGPGFNFALKTLDYSLEKGQITPEVHHALVNEMYRRQEEGDYLMTYGHGHYIARKPRET